jgi:hypothetical protein
MTPARTSAAGVLLAVLIAVGLPPAGPGPMEAGRGAAWAGRGAAWAGPCHNRGVEVDLAGSGDVGVVSGHAAACSTASPSSPRSAPAPYYTDELMCPPGRAAVAGGLCSATPCQRTGRYFALRTLHFTNGGQRVARSVCMSLGHARAAPGVSTAEVLEAVRAVKLPGGSIHAAPSGRGLANLITYFRLGGVASRTVDLRLRGSMIHAEFQVAEYRWAFGDGSAGASLATGLPDSLARAHAYPRRGRYEVQVEVGWSAVAFLDGRRVGRVDDLVSAARVSYPVAEIRTALSG